MPYHFPADIERRIRAQIETGAFETEDAVLREAIDTLERRQKGLARLQEMVREADEDILQGRVRPFNAQKTKASVRARLEAHGIGDSWP
jgi:Arc/MetJ-type ribon-helix-helix transcriptional regulator